MGFGEWLKNVLSHKNDFSSFFFSWRRTPTLNSKKQVCHYHAKIRLDEMSYFIFSFSYLDLMIKSNCSDAFYPAQIKCIMFYDAFFLHTHTSDLNCILVGKTRLCTAAIPRQLCWWRSCMIYISRTGPKKTLQWLFSGGKRRKYAVIII